MHFRFESALIALLAVIFATSSQALPSSHHVRLLDGSTLQGKVLLLDDAQLIIATSYSDSLRIPRAQVAAIMFTEEVVHVAPATELVTPPAPMGEGQLEIAFKGDAPRSSTRFRRKEERERVIALNVLHLKVYVDGRQVHHDQDASIEKEYFDRGWTFLRNEHHFPPVKLTLPAGTHKVLVVVGNEMDLLNQGEKQTGVLSSELAVEEVIVRDGEKSRIAIMGDSSRFHYGRYEMKLLSSQ